MRLVLRLVSRLLAFINFSIQIYLCGSLVGHHLRSANAVFPASF